MLVHRSDALRYRFVVGAVPLAPLQILACRTFAWGDWQGRAFVLGKSHALTLTRGAFTVTELFTCDTGDDTDYGPANGTVPLRLPGLTGATTITRFALDCCGDALTGPFAPADTLTANFPPAPGHALPALPPCTRIGWQVCGDGSLIWETVHTYPHENIGVRTRTRLENTP